MRVVGAQHWADRSLRRGSDAWTILELSDAPSVQWLSLTGPRHPERYESSCRDGGALGTGDDPAAGASPTSTNPRPKLALLPVLEPPWLGRQDTLTAVQCRVRRRRSNSSPVAKPCERSACRHGPCMASSWHACSPLQVAREASCPHHASKGGVSSRFQVRARNGLADAELGSRGSRYSPCLGHMAQTPGTQSRARPPSSTTVNAAARTGVCDKLNAGVDSGWRSPSPCQLSSVLAWRGLRDAMAQRAVC